ncbi:hypothetical protein [Methylobacterium gnaphalii]|uniref:Uncharacterized protein n=1 Tax=Methylobacterium gnaphalii TaxID=1010610 RepID=A0A512JGL5_9HYPH|nr:hypothetical protein [Methylobacterium gnaphalii]GEP09105.1 hypothetical protein MGN01_09500 [Methylobacterium gnaphalii]GJD68418.1 hypothetical protein MMMDOFMJ_1341 [Methylobacterium gnaphalii]GLS49029.1 hypothetical protein GCM10007885_18760 [Methylobacterium gnaphalii]
MTVKRVALAAMAATVLGMAVGAVPATAQYGGPYYGGDEYDRPRRYERRYDDEYRPRPRPYGRQGSLCVTKRGNCPYPPAPQDSPCRCEIPGFGPKRGAIDNGY